MIPFCLFNLFQKLLFLLFWGMVVDKAPPFSGNFNPESEFGSPAVRRLVACFVCFFETVLSKGEDGCELQPSLLQH